MQLSLLRNICPSSMAKTPPPPHLPPSERSPGLSRMGRCAPGRAPLSLRGPAVLSRLAQGPSIIHDDPASAPPPPHSEEHARTLTVQLKGHGALGISMKDDRVVPPPPYRGGCHHCMLACPLAKVRGEPSSAMSVNKKGSHLTTTTSPPLPGSVCVFFSYT